MTLHPAHADTHGLEARPDREMPAHDAHPASLRLWLRLLSCSLLIEGAIRQQLRQQFDVTLSRFDLLAQLARYRGGLTMGELTRRMMFSGGNVTAIVIQLETEGLVQRDNDPKDRRSFKVKLTPEGRKGFRKMAKVHEQWVVDLLSGLPDQDQAQLHQLLGNLKTAVHRQQTRHEQEAP